MSKLWFHFTFKGWTIRKVMGRGLGNFQLTRVCFAAKTLYTNFFGDKYCFFPTVKS